MLDFCRNLKFPVLLTGETLFLFYKILKIEEKTLKVRILTRLSYVNVWDISI